MVRPATALLMALSLLTGCKFGGKNSHHEDPKNDSKQTSDLSDPGDPAGLPTGIEDGFALVGPPLQTIGPIHPMHGFPMWYSDATGSKVELCVDADPLCVVPPTDYNPSKPLLFPENFPGEGFYWLAENKLTISTGGTLRILFGIEAAFALGTPMPGQRITFGRTLFVSQGMANGLYRITHPYGVYDLEIASGRIRDVTDVGIANEQFSGVLKAPFGTLLRWDTAAPAGYLGDSRVAHTFTGSPLGTNYFRVEQINGANLTVVADSNVATIAGRLARSIVVPSLAPNTFTISPKFILVADDANKNIFYTIDGTDPTTSTTRIAYNSLPTPEIMTLAPSNLAGTTTLRTVYEHNGVYGSVSTYPYTIDPTLISVNAIPDPGVFAAPVSVSLALSGPGTSIKYTLDGTDPLTSLTAVVYNNTPISVVNNGTAFIRYIGVRLDATNKIVATSLERKAYYFIQAEKLARSEINPAYELPFWVRDSNGVALVPCVDPLDPFCLPPAVAGPGSVDLTQPVVYPRNFAGETFLWNASAALTGAQGGKALLVMAIEGAFSTPTATPGERVLFGRIRISVDASTAGQYRVTHPYGVNYFNVLPGSVGVRAINYTEDISPVANNFDVFRFGRVGPFLTWDVGAPAGYVGDPAVPHKVTGSPFNTNYFRVELLVGGVYQPVYDTNLFTVSGKLGGSLDVAASPMGALYTTPRDITLAASNANATIYYTTDNTDPNASPTRIQYLTTFPVNTTTVVKYVAVMPDGTISPVRTATYTIDTTPPVVTALPGAGLYKDQTTVTLSGSRAGKIYYTLDASSPLTSTTRVLYTAPLSIRGPSQVSMQAVLIDQTGLASAIRQDTYTFNMTLPTVTPPVSKMTVNSVVTTTTIPVETTWSGTAVAGRTITKYTLDRSLNGGIFSPIALTTPTATQYIGTLASGNSFEYRVTATDSGETISPSLRSGVTSLSVLQENAGTVVYRGNWLRTVATTFFGGAARSTTVRGNSATVRFTGTQVAWITAVGPTMGIATITIDGSAQGSVDLYSATSTTKVLKVVKTGLTRAAHTMVITSSGTRNARSLGTRVDLDAIAVIN